MLPLLLLGLSPLSASAAVLWDKTVDFGGLVSYTVTVTSTNPVIIVHARGFTGGWTANDNAVPLTQIGSILYEHDGVYDATWWGVPTNGSNIITIAGGGSLVNSGAVVYSGATLADSGDIDISSPSSQFQVQTGATSTVDGWFGMVGCVASNINTGLGGSLMVRRGSFVPTVCGFFDSSSTVASGTALGVSTYGALIYSPADYGAGSYYILPPYTAPAPSITLDFPPNSDVIPDFANWVVSWANLPTSTQGGAIGVCYSHNGASYNCQYDDAIDFSPTVNVAPLAIPKHQALWYIPLTDPAVWDVFVKVVDNMGNVVASTEPMTIYISPNAAPPAVTTTTILASPFSPLGGGETSSTLANPATNCNATSSSFWGQAVVDVQNGVCLAFTFLFIPNSPQQLDIGTRFNTLSSHISTKPPIGYFTLIKNDLNSLSEGTSSIVLLDASATTAFAPVISPIYAGATYLLWFLFALWLFNRIRHFDFQA